MGACVISGDVVTNFLCINQDVKQNILELSVIITILAPEDYFGIGVLAVAIFNYSHAGNVIELLFIEADLFILLRPEEPTFVCGTYHGVENIDGCMGEPGSDVLQVLGLGSWDYEHWISPVRETGDVVSH